MTDLKLVNFQFSLSTAEEEANLLPAQSPAARTHLPRPTFEPGLYRVVDGQLYRLIPGAPLKE